MSDPPVNVRFEIPTEPPPHWDEEAQRWRHLNATPLLINGQSRVGHPGFYPLTIKAAYVIGVIYDLCLTVSYLLQPSSMRDRFYIPAYGVFASGVDLLGRCLQGNNTHNAGPDRNNPDILAGFKWLKEPSYPAYETVQRDEVLIETSRELYSLDMLMALRHFAAHGQATTNTRVYDFRDIDYEILGKMPPLLARGLDEYWNSLGAHSRERLEVNELLCNRLARASIAGFRNGPIYNSWILFQGHGSGESITNIFQRFNWSI